MLSPATQHRSQASNGPIPGKIRLLENFPQGVERNIGSFVILPAQGLRRPNRVYLYRRKGLTHGAFNLVVQLSLSFFVLMLPPLLARGIQRWQPIERIGFNLDPLQILQHAGVQGFNLFVYLFGNEQFHNIHVAMSWNIMSDFHNQPHFYGINWRNSGRTGPPQQCS
ncbi:hypothetical protein [Nodosilinea sp. LEGE 06152]|uniref:hypothetical protein n=1 Tax=Nodosilinea sp. LEGE 06152 TaxID=2777966 RepID=UPI002106D6C2|nr:hypothetical protein [Nodosilinea sp. LEGE 06152]